MEKYNDFALPSLENMEQMAKAFKENELGKVIKRKEESINNKNQVANKEQMQEFYYSTEKICAIADLLYSKHKKNDQMLEIFECCKKIKIKVDGVILDYGLEDVKDYVVAENTALQDFCINSAKCIRICLENMHILDLKNLAYEFLELIEIVCRY